MSQWLRQGTARTITFGPFLAKGNGVSILSDASIITAIDHATTGILISKNGGVSAIRHQAVSASSYDAHGFFKVTLDATDTDTPGTLLVMHSNPSVYLAVWRVFLVVPAQVWDSLFGSDKLDVSVVEQANIDFGALQKISLNAATPAHVQDIPATGSGFTALGDARLANLDALISSRLAATGYTVPPTVQAIQSGLATATALGVVDGLIDAIKLAVDTYLDAAISSRLAAIDYTAPVVQGSETYTDTILDPDNDPIEGVQVEAYSDSDRTTLVDVQETDVNGIFVFHLNPGTYYMRAVKSGYSFTDWSKVIA